MAKLRMSATDCCKILRNGRIFAHFIERRYVVDGTTRDPMHERAVFKIRQVLLTYVRREIDARMTRPDYYCGGANNPTAQPKTWLEFLLRLPKSSAIQFRLQSQSEAMASSQF